MRKNIIYSLSLLAFPISVMAQSCDNDPQGTVNLYAKKYEQKITSEIENLKKFKVETDEFQVSAYANLLKAKEIVAKNQSEPTLIEWCKKSIKELHFNELTEKSYYNNFINLQANLKQVESNSNCFGKIACDQYIKDYLKYSGNIEEIDKDGEYSFVNIFSYLNSKSKVYYENNLEQVTECKNNLTINDQIAKAIIQTEKDNLLLLDKKSQNLTESYLYEEKNKTSYNINKWQNISAIINGINPENLSKDNLELCNKLGTTDKNYLVYIKDRVEFKRDILLNISLKQLCMEDITCKKNETSMAQNKAKEKKSNTRFNELFKNFKQSINDLNQLNSKLPQNK